MALKSFLSLGFIALLLLILSGCAAPGGPSGRWEVDDSVRQAFASGHIFPHHAYYYLGSITAPDSIIAIDRRFTLRTRVWAEIEISDQVMTGWLTWLRTEDYGPCPYYGGVILTPEGQVAGYWYSRNSINYVEMPEPGVLVVFQPYSAAQTRCGAQDGQGFFGDR